jgi:hypothetical protein
MAVVVPSYTGFRWHCHLVRSGERRRSSSVWVGALSDIPCVELSSSSLLILFFVVPPGGVLVVGDRSNLGEIIYPGVR